MQKNILKSVFPILVLAGFIGAAIFGFMAINHDNHSHNFCAVARSKSADCPDKVGSLLYATFHIEALKAFSAATFGALEILLILFAFFIFTALAILTKPRFLFDNNLMPLIPSRIRINLLKDLSSLQRQEFSDWVSFHKNSPNTAGV